MDKILEQTKTFCRLPKNLKSMTEILQHDLDCNIEKITTEIMNQWLMKCNSKFLNKRSIPNGDELCRTKLAFIQVKRTEGMDY